MKNRIIATLFLTGISPLLHAQESPIESFQEDYRKLSIKMDYFGELLLHPGAAVGIEYTIKSDKRIDLHSNAEIGGYYHKGNQNALFLNGMLGAKFFISQAVFIDLNLGIGYLHTFPQGDVYESTSTGVEARFNWGHPHFRPSFVLLSGWDASRKRNLPLSFHAGFDAALESSVNHIFIPHLALRAGVTLKLSKQDNF